MSEFNKSLTIVLGVTVDMSLSFLRDFPQALAARGWSVHVVSSPGPGFDEYRDIEGVHLHPIPMEREPNPLRDLVSLYKWLKFLLKVKPDVVSLGTPKVSFIGLMAAFLVRVPRRTYHLRGLRLEGESGFRYVILRAMEKLTAAFSTDVLAVSPSLKQVALELRLVRPPKIQVIGAGSSNGVDLERYQPATMCSPEKDKMLSKLGLDRGIPVLGFVGRLAPDKGIDDLLQVSRNLRERGINHQMLLVGNIEDPMLKSSDTLEKAAGGRVLVTGRVKDTQPYYQLMDVLLLPTLREGMPNVVLEAQASGVPVITTNVTGARDSIIDDSTGVLTRYGDIGAMVQAVEKILSNPDKQRSMARAGRRFVEEYFDRHVVWQGLMDYYSIPRERKPKQPLQID